MSKLNSPIQEALITTLRTITGNDSLPVEFDEDAPSNFFSWNQNLVKVGRVTIPHIGHPELVEGSQELGTRSFDKLRMTGEGGRITEKERAAADLAACYLLFHDSEIHQDHQFFNEFEKVRVIAQIKDLYRGAAQNILGKIKEDLSSAAGNLSLILLGEIFADKDLKKCVADLEKNLDSKIISEIKNLKDKTSDQQSFAQAVERLLSMLTSDEKVTDENGEAEEKNNESPNSNQENTEGRDEEKFSQEEQEAEGLSDKKPEKPEMKADEKKGQATLRLDKENAEEDRIEFKKSYKIYTTKFDEVVFPPKMVSKNELESLRDQLELRLNKLGGISRKMSLKLKRKLLSKRDSFLEFDSSRGILDRKKLTRIVTSPYNEDIWVNNKNHEYHDTALTILLDNSGSMRGQPIVMAALACEIIAEILEKFAVKTEIIGFTTADWKGGKARKLWESSGRLPNPGRLNELRHIIYKHFKEKFKKSKTNLGLMLKEGILKENIDGEALLFARSRLMQQSEKRKILMVISDGTPVDDSTNSANDHEILIEHLHHVIKKTEKAGKIEIVGIGIGHATDEFYRNSTMIRSPEELGDVMIEKLVGLL